MAGRWKRQDFGFYRSNDRSAEREGEQRNAFILARFYDGGEALFLEATPRDRNRNPPTDRSPQHGK